MAHNHRMSPIADPYLNTRKRLMEVSGGYRDDYRPAGLEGRSNMQADTEYDEDYFPEGRPAVTDADLMPDTDLPISTTERAFGESGHGFSVRKGKKGQ